MNSQELKSALFYELREMINGRIITINRALRSAKDARNKETKSTAGDKHETGRAMMQIEEDKLRVSLSKALVLKANLAKVPVKGSSESVELGSLVHTDKGLFYVSIGLGKLVHLDKTYFAISISSPIGRMLLGKKVGDTVTYREAAYVIEEID